MFEIIKRVFHLRLTIGIDKQTFLQNPSIGAFLKFKIKLINRYNIAKIQVLPPAKCFLHVETSPGSNVNLITLLFSVKKQCPNYHVQAFPQFYIVGIRG